MGETEAEVVSDGSALEKRGMTAGQAMKTGEFWLAIISCIMVVFASSAILMNDIGYYVECGIDTAKAASYHGILLTRTPPDTETAWRISTSNIISKERQLTATLHGEV